MTETWQELKCEYNSPISHSQAITYQNEMIFYGGYYQTKLNDIIRINLDNYTVIIRPTYYETSFWHSSNIWNDELLIFGGIYLESSEEIIYHNLVTNRHQRFQIQGFKSGHNISHFIHEDNLYVHSNSSILKFDLIKHYTTKIECDFKSIIRRGSSLFYYNEFIYVYGGYTVNDFYKINFNTFEVEQILHYETKLPISYTHSGFLYNNEIIIYGIYDGKKASKDLLRIKLSKMINLNSFYHVINKHEKDIHFKFL